MKDFDHGVAFVGEQTADVIAAELGAQYIGNVERAIESLYERMNAYDYYKATIPAQESLKGFMFEEWSAGTGNIDAAVKGKRDVAEVLTGDRFQLGSPDVGTTDGLLYQLKMKKDPASTVRELGTTLFDRYKGVQASEHMSFDDWASSVGFAGKSPGDLLYDGQFSLVASDRLAEYQKEAFRRLQKAKALNKPDEIVRWQKVSDGLTDRITFEDGVESKPMTLEEARQKAISVTEGKKLDPADDNMTLTEVIKIDSVVRQALKAGVSAAAITAVAKVVPEIYKAIDYLLEEGEITPDHLRAIGSATVDGAATGFLNGSAAAAITIAASKGVFGQAIKEALKKPIGPPIVGTLVVLTLETCKDAFALSRGRITSEQLSSHLTEGVYISVLSLVGFGIATLVAPEATIPAMIGSMVGSAVGALSYSPAKACFLQLSKLSGFTFFGTVDQDYELPAPILKKLGIKGARYKIASADFAEAKSIHDKIAYPKGALIHTLNIELIDRDIVGINKIGYVLR